MKFLSMLMIALLSVTFVHAQETPKGGGATVGKQGAAVRGPKGGGAVANKRGVAAKGPKGKGVEADKNGARTTPKKTK